MSAWKSQDGRNSGQVNVSDFRDVDSLTPIPVGDTISDGVNQPVGYHTSETVESPFHNILSDQASPYPTSDNQCYVKFDGDD
jgi:hypothetical protein